MWKRRVISEILSGTVYTLRKLCIDCMSSFFLQGGYVPDQQAHLHPNMAGGGPPPQGGSGGTPVIVQYVNAPNFGPHPVNMTCPHCQSQIRTSTDSEPGPMAWILAGILCVVGWVEISVIQSWGWTRRKYIFKFKFSPVSSLFLFPFFFNCFIIFFLCSFFSPCTYYQSSGLGVCTNCNCDW